MMDWSHAHCAQEHEAAARLCPGAKKMPLVGQRHVRNEISRRDIFEIYKFQPMSSRTSMRGTLGNLVKIPNAKRTVARRLRRNSVADKIAQCVKKAGAPNAALRE